MTFSGNFDNKKDWKKLKLHNERTQKNHKNKYLKTKKSKELRRFNYHVKNFNFDNKINQLFGQYVKQRDQRLTNQKYRYGSVARFFKVDSRGKPRRTHPDLLYVAKMGDEKTWHKLENKLQQKGFSFGQINNAVVQGLIKYGQGFSKRNSNLLLSDFYVHMDEEGSPHLHAHVLPFVDRGKTKKGNLRKPSTSLNTALAKQYHMPRNGQATLKHFRDLEDHALAKSISVSLTNSLNTQIDLKLVRKTDKHPDLQTGVDHEIYVQRKHELDSIIAKIKDKQEQFSNVQKDLKKTQKVISQADNVKKQQQADYEKKQAALQQQVQDRQRELDQQQQDVKDSLAAREAEIAKREHSLTIRENKQTKREKSWRQALGHQIFAREFEFGYQRGCYTGKNYQNDLQAVQDDNHDWIDSRSQTTFRTNAQGRTVRQQLLHNMFAKHPIMHAEALIYAVTASLNNQSKSDFQAELNDLKCQQVAQQRLAQQTQVKRQRVGLKSLDIATIDPRLALNNEKEKKERENDNGRGL